MSLCLKELNLVNVAYSVEKCSIFFKALVIEMLKKI